MTKHEPAAARPVKRKRTFRWSKLLLILAAVFCIVQLCGKIDRYRALEDEVALYEAQLAQAQAEYEEKQATIALLDNEAYIERLARENLGMVKAGETVVSAIRTPSQPETPAAPETQL